jgi:RNA recognition motif-containing protein
MNIFAGNLAPEVTENDLRDTFKAFGEVAFVNIVRDRGNRVSMGYGFLHMPVEGEAEAAISGLNGRDLKGKILKVTDARPRPLPTPA